MEEARQYSPLTSQQRLFAWVYHLGSIALVVSICLQIFRRVDALYPAILLVGSTRIGLAAWQLAWPPDAQTDRTRSGLVINIAVWGSVILLLIWARLYGAGS